MKKTYLLALLLAFSFFSYAQKKEIESTAEIKNVTVYNLSAEISYQKEINLSQGINTITFTDLTPYIVDNTTSVSASVPDMDIITVT
jgi:hypothetical protein